MKDNAIVSKDVMPIAGFFGPYPQAKEHKHILPNLISDEIYEMIADAGIKLIVYSNIDYQKAPDLVMKSLDLGHKYGIGQYIFDSTVLDYAGNDKIDVEVLKEQIGKYNTHPAFRGMYIVDEPRTAYYLPTDGTKDIDKFVKLADILQYQLGYDCYLNMFPVWNLPVNQQNFIKYVDEFCTTLNPKVVSWDKYPFSTKDDISVYFYIMSLMRDYAKKMHVPFWAAIQAGGQWNDEKKRFDSEVPYYPNEAQLHWNVNTCLAFGAQGLYYFPLMQPKHFAWAESTEWDFKRNGIVGANGVKNEWHEYAKRINRQIRAVDEVLMNSVHQGVITSGVKAKEDVRLTTCILESGQFRELVSVVGEAMIGCFDYCGKTALYVVNYSMEQPQNITLCLNDMHHVKMIQKTESSCMSTQKVMLEMTAGEGVLLVIE